MTQPTPGTTARDAEADGSRRVFITNVYDEAAEDYIITYDYNKNPITVHNYEDEDGNQPNKKYPADDPVVGVVYIETLKENGFYPEMDLDEIRDALDSGPLREYTFPASRLEPLR